MKKVAYITSGKIGIPRFTYNELKTLKRQDVDFVLCLTQLKSGPCMPEPEWSTIKANRMKAISEFVDVIKPKSRQLNFFLQGYKLGVLPYYFMALSFYRDLKNLNISSIHCQMGDDKLFIGYFLKLLLNIPLSVTVHAHELYKRKVYEQNSEMSHLPERGRMV